MRLAGREIEAIMKNQDTLVIRCTDGIEAHIAWMDTEGNPTQGEPTVTWYGKRVFANTDHIGLAPKVASGG